MADWAYLALMRRYYLLFLVVFTACSQSYDLVISDVQVINLEDGSLKAGDLFIRDSILVHMGKVGSGHNANASQYINGKGGYVIPGLWDMHVHTQDSSYLSLYLDHGIVGIRDMGGCVNRPTDGCESLCPDHLRRWKRAISIGELEGPELFFAGPTLSGTGWPSSLPVGTKEEVAAGIEQLLGEEVDFLKVYEKIPAGSYEEIARLARLHGLDFAGHVSETMLLSEVADMGQKSIEHLREPILFCFTSDSLALEAFMQADGYTDEDREFVAPWVKDSKGLIDVLKRNGTWFTPTMAVQYARQRHADSSWISHSLRAQLPESVFQGFLTHMERMRNNEDVKGDSLWWMAHKKLVKRFSEEGVGLLAGSDSACEGGIPGYSLHEELFLMVEEAGLSPLEALRTATLNPVLYFELRKQGSVNASNYANLLLLSENPLENIRNTLSIRAVIKEGKVLRINEEP